MRPETLRLKLNKAIYVWLKNKDSRQIKKLIKRMEAQWLSWAEEEADFRVGEETYGYLDIESTMMYISDRWRCAFRLKWIIDGVNGGKI